MIRVSITEVSGQIMNISVVGHAGSSRNGMLDLVCAEVSAVTTGLCNALDEFEIDCDFTLESGLVVIHLNQNSEIAQIILKTGIIQLKTIEETNNQFIKLKIMEG